MSKNNCLMILSKNCVANFEKNYLIPALHYIHRILVKFCMSFFLIVYKLGENLNNIGQANKAFIVFHKFKTLTKHNFQKY